MLIESLNQQSELCQLHEVSAEIIVCFVHYSSFSSDEEGLSDPVFHCLETQLV